METKFEDFSECIKHFKNEFKNIDVAKRQKSGSRDDYKKELTEMNNVFYSVNATKIITKNKSHYAYPFWVIGEILSEFFGMNPPLMTKYKQNIIEQSYKLKRDKTVEYSYGERWREHNQINNIIDTLCARQDSKRCVMCTFMPYDTYTHRLDVPCTIIHQFLIRDNKCDLFTFFRSHDFFSGFKYDVFLSSFLCQFVTMCVNAKMLTNIKPGRLYFADGSLHVYSRDLNKLNTLHVDGYVDFNIMHDYNNIQNVYDDMNNLKKSEECSYWGDLKSASSYLSEIHNPMIADFAKVFFNRNSKYINADDNLKFSTKTMNDWRT